MTTTDTAPTPAPPADDDAATDAFVEKVFAAVLGAQEVQAAAIGDRLGWYDALAAGAATSTELAEATGTDERYAREWLEHQTVAGWIACEDPTLDALARRYLLPPGHVEVLTDREGLAHVLPLARFAAGAGKHLDALVEAYRTGAGVSWDDLGDDLREGQAAMNRPLFVRQLGHEHLRSIPDVDAALRAGGRVADVGAGYAWSSIGVAQAYPEATVDAFDLDAPSIERARRHIAEAGVADRVTAHCVDAATVSADVAYDLVLALECIHDLPDPVGVLATMRRLAGDHGAVIVMDENVGDVFTGEPDDVERVMYGFSLTCCLPDGRAHEHSVATGTVMRASTLEAYAREAGFAAVEVLPVENDFFRFYRLR